MRPAEYLSLFARRHHWAKSVLLRLIPNTPRTVRVPGIGPMRIRTRDHRSYWLRDPLEHDRLFLGGIQNLARPGMVAWDVGAHIGLYARMLSQVMNAGHVLAFEPDPRNRALLEENLRLGGIADRATAVPFALGDKDATVEFLADTESTQQGHIAGIRNADGTSHAPRLSVEERTIDSLVASGEYPGPDFIKIDVEGAEAMVLRGARQTLRDHAPVLAIELHGLEVRLPVFDELAAAGYVVYGYRTKTWRRLTRDDFKEVTSLYDPRHIYAAKEAGLLQKPAFIIELDGAKA